MAGSGQELTFKLTLESDGDCECNERMCGTLTDGLLESRPPLDSGNEYPATTWPWFSGFCGRCGSHEVYFIIQNNEWTQHHALGHEEDTQMDKRVIS